MKLKVQTMDSRSEVTTVLPLGNLKHDSRINFARKCPASGGGRKRRLQQLWRPVDMDVEDSLPALESSHPFIKGKVPKFRYDDPQGLTFVKQQIPVILTGADLVRPALKWDIPYLRENFGHGPHTVYVNSRVFDQSGTENGGVCSANGVTKCRPKSENHYLFKYFDVQKAKDYTKEFVPPMVKHDMTFEEFLIKFYGDRNKERIYFQQRLNNTVGRQVASDFVQFNWKWLVHMAQEWNWGPLTSNLLLIGQEGNVTPCHYDEQQNLFCQLQGRKRILLFSPDNFPCLYPYPVHHPHDRQSQVDFDYPDYERFPKLKDLKGLEAVVLPGEILYIPMYWWHHVINVDDTIAINFWHKVQDSATATIEYPLKSHQKVAMVRNVEKMLLQALQNQDDLTNLLHWIVDGRY